jgi:hypothetical protein
MSAGPGATSTAASTDQLMANGVQMIQQDLQMIERAHAARSGR